MNINVLGAILYIKKVLFEIKGSYFLFPFPTMQWHLDYICYWNEIKIPWKIMLIDFY